jgi:AraC-like DNA-binding protein
MNERFQVARELLSNTNMSIGDIIFHIGYENTSYFHKEFKKRYGMTPKAFRREHQNKKIQN